MYGVLGEDKSDFETLKILVQRLVGKKKVCFQGKGYTGCGELLKKGGKDLKLLSDMGCTRFIIAHDADQRDVNEVRLKLIDKIVRPSGVKKSICLLVPVQEIEAWLLADIEAVTNIFTGWNPKPEASPESKPRPKEYLEKLSRDASGSPRYRHPTHNPHLAKHIDLTTVSNRCKSFRPLEEFVNNGKGNY